MSKTANPTFTRTYNWSISKSVTPTGTVDIASGSSQTFNYTVDVNETGSTDSAWQVTGTITVSNPNSGEAITLTGVSDSINDGGVCTFTGGDSPTASVPASGSVTLDYTCTYTGAPTKLTGGTNTATASWSATAAHTPDGTASGTASVDFTTPTSTMNKTVTVTDTFNGGTPATLGTLTATDSTPFTSQTYSPSQTVSGVAGTCTSYDNTATIVETSQTTDKVSVTVCVGADLTVSKTATPKFTRTYNWNITKSVDKSEIDIAQGGSATFNYTVNVNETGFTDSAWQVAGTITVTNPNDWEAITANVADTIDNNGSCTVTGGTNVSVPAGQSVMLNYICTYASAPSPASGINTASATWDSKGFFTPDGSASGTATYAFGAPTTTANQTVTVTDTFNGGTTTTLGTLTATDSTPFASQTYSPSQTVSGVAGTCTSYDNTATIVETSQTTDKVSVTVCVGADLTVSKTATPKFTRTYAWAITKAVDKTLVKQVGGTVTFNYIVTAYETGPIDSGWTVTGQITVTNPNDWEAITANVSDLVDNGGSCTVSGGTGVSVPASSSQTLNYTCTYALAPSPSSGTNTATATWDKTAASTPTDSASGTAPFAFTTPTTFVNKTVTITDSFNGGTATQLGMLTATDVQPFATATYKYARIISVPTFGCKTYDNTATIKETGQTAGTSVTVCGPAKTGALTMGFWQNKNGQSIITGGSSTSGVCNSGTWLRTYAPFQDLSSTATCAQVASYVSGVIKGANASGASMNAILKAQMLATALDVYFSDPALGGNKIGAYNGLGNSQPVIGTIFIDLANICHMIDSSNGTATCSGTFENAGPAFGGATSMTVSQMLAYAAGKSDVGGINWYNNIKATQQLAKDAFDAINNQVAFAP